MRKKCRSFFLFSIILSVFGVTKTCYTVVYLRIILFRMQRRDTATEDEFDAVLQMKLEHVASSRPEVFLTKGVLKICIKFTGEHPCRSVTSIKLLCYIAF